MGHNTIDHVRKLVESVLEDTAEKPKQFKLRTALQLLYFVEEQQEAAELALTQGELDEQTREHLQRVGYLEGQ